MKKPPSNNTQRRNVARFRLLLVLIAAIFLLQLIGHVPATNSSAHADDAETPAIDANAVDYAAYVAERPYRVGYRRMEFEVALSDGGIDDRQLDVWYPTAARERRHNYFGQVGRVAVNADVADEQHPLLVFSHGFLGASDQTIFLMEACARAGYIVVSMNHHDALLNPRERRMESPEFADADSWDDSKYRDRHDDVEQLLDRFLEWNEADGSDWSGRIDRNAIGAMGHSLGGYTMLGMAGAWPSWRDRRIQAVVAFSPYALPYSHNGELDEVTIPVMLQGGTLDFGITPFLPRVYDRLGGPKAYLVLKNETHFGWTNLVALGKSTAEAIESGNAELMVRYTLAFFDQHLLGIDCAEVLEADEPDLEEYHHTNGD
jgi:predicted dienelactone hydrolase